MAEYTRMRNNVLGYPIYGLPYVIAFPLLDEDGDPVTGLTCDSEISKNGNTAVDCHNEGVEIAFDTATNKGIYYLDLTGAHTGTETVADVVAVTIYTGVATSQATCIVLYPKKLPKILSGTVGATGNDTTHVHIPDGVAINDFYNGCVLHMNESGNDECRMITDYVASTKLATLNLALDAAPTASTSTYDVYMTEVAIASILALMVGMVPNAVAGEANGLTIAGSNAATTFATLSVTGQLDAGNVLVDTTVVVTTNLTVSGTTTLTGNVTVTGTLGIGAVTLSALTVTNATTLTGAVSLGSTLGVTGATTFTGAVVLSSTLATGAVTLSALTVTNALLVSGTTTLTGNVTLSGTLGVGATTLASATVTAALTAGSIVNNGVFTQTGAVTLASTLATGAVTLSALTITNNLLVSGTSTFTGNVTLSGTLGVGATTLSSLSITGQLDAGNVLVDTTTVLTGAVTLSSTLATGAVTFSALTITNNLLISGTTTGTGTVSLTGLTNTTIADAVLDEVFESVGATDYTLRKLARGLLSWIAGKASGGGTITPIIRDVGDTKPRITYTADLNGNRTAVTLDVT